MEGRAIAYLPALVLRGGAHLYTPIRLVVINATTSSITRALRFLVVSMWLWVY